MTNFWKEHKVFITLFLLLTITSYISLFQHGPMNVHIWRQTDCLSLTQQYYEGAKFLEPEMHMQMGDGYSSGKTTGEFPGMYYVMAQIWKVTGMNYWSYRLFMYLIFAAGAFAFYWSLTKLFKERWLALSLAFMLIASPTYLFYSVSFLTDAPAFSLVLMALAVTLAYTQKPRLLLFYAAMLLFMLAGLIKISSLIAFVFLGGLWVLELLGAKSLGPRKLFHKPIAEFPGFVAVVGGIYAWYAYAKAYNFSHGFKYTYNDIFPFWVMESDKIWPWFKGIFSENILVYFSYPILLLLLVLWVFNVFSFKRLPLIAWLANVLVIVGGLTYFILWAPLFNGHDYYYIALLILFPAIVVPFAWQMGQLGWFQRRPKIAKGIIIGLAAFSFVYGIQMLHLKSEPGYDAKPLTAPMSFVHTMRWFNWNKRTHWDAYVRLKGEFERLGVTKSTKVVSIPDDSFNISLFLMDRKGWTNFIGIDGEEKMNKVLANGAAFMVIADTTWLEKDFLQPYLQEPLGTFEHLHLFRLSPLP